MAIKNADLSTGTAIAIYTSTGNTVISTMHIPNYTGTPITANLYVAPSGFIANNTNIIYGNVSISAFNTLVIDKEKFILANGDKIFANVSATTSASATVTYTGF